MDIRTLERRIKASSLVYGETYGIDVSSPDYIALKLAEEAGEVVKAYVRHTGRSRRGKLDPAKSRHDLGRELADLIGMALIMSHDHGIDIEAMLAESWDLDGARPAEEAP
ncbi:MAG: pyrophosphatase [Beijerinckiaceae bacterium]